VGDAVTEASAAIGLRRIGDLWRLLASGSFASTALELLGVALIANGLRLLYPPAMWVFLGVACFAASYAIEATRSKGAHTRAPEALARDDSPDDPFTDEPFTTGEQR
jgi:hypothetical protein